MQANAFRSASTAERDVFIAGLVADAGLDLPSPWLAVARARREQPGATWAEVGMSIGISKHAAVGAFRRLRQHLAGSGDPSDAVDILVQVSNAALRCAREKTAAGKSLSRFEREVAEEDAAFREERLFYHAAPDGGVIQVIIPRWLPSWFCGTSA
jgi:hypothetical protein